MCVVNYISRFSKEGDVNNNVYLIDTELTDKVKNWKQLNRFLMIKFFTASILQPNWLP